MAAENANPRMSPLGGGGNDVFFRAIGFEAVEMVDEFREALDGLPRLPALVPCDVVAFFK